MSRTISPLDAIIKVTDKSERVPDGSLQLILDEKSRKVLQKEPPLLRQWGRKIGYYTVSSSQTAKCEDISILLENGLTMDLSFTARCPRGNEQRVLASLFEEDRSFEAVLQEKLRSYVVAAASLLSAKQPALAFVERLKEAVAENCLTQTGLMIVPELRFQQGTNLQRFVLKSGPFSVRVPDYDENLNLEFEMEVQAIPEQWEMALKKTPNTDQLKEKIKERIINTISTSASLDQFCLSLNITNPGGNNHQSIKDLLVSPIADILALEGRQLGYLQLNSASIANIKPPDNFEIEHSYSYKLDDETQKITVKSDVRLRLVSISAYKREEERRQIKQSKMSFQEWFRTAVITTLVKEVLFIKTYRDILLGPGKIKEEIDLKMQEKAAEIGYAIVQHTHLPDIDKLKLQQEFFIEMDEAFETNSADVKIRLKISLRGRIRNLKDLDERLLSPTVNIKSEMEAAIRATVQDKVHRIEPERVYMRFNYTEEDDKTVNQLLCDAIAGVLSTKYSVDAASLNPIVKLNESEDAVFIKARELRNKPRKIKVVSYAGNIEPVHYTLTYEIVGVHRNGWHIFQSKISRDLNEEIAELEDALRTSIANKLNSLKYENLISEDSGVKKQIKDNIFKPTFREIGDPFGLNLVLITDIRERTGSEGVILDINQAAFETKKENDIKQLKFDYENKERRLALLNQKEEEAITMDDMAEAKKIRAEIDALKKEGNDGLFGGIDVLKLQQQIRSEHTKNSNLLESGPQDTLPVNNNA